MGALLSNKHHFSHGRDLKLICPASTKTCMLGAEAQSLSDSQWGGGIKAWRHRLDAERRNSRSIPVVGNPGTSSTASLCFNGSAGATQRVPLTRYTPFNARLVTWWKAAVDLKGANHKHQEQMWEQLTSSRFQQRIGEAVLKKKRKLLHQLPRLLIAEAWIWVENGSLHAWEHRAGALTNTCFICVEIELTSQQREAN